MRIPPSELGAWAAAALAGAAVAIALVTARKPRRPIVPVLVMVWLVAASNAAFHLGPVRSVEVYEGVQAYARAELQESRHTKFVRRLRLQHLATASYGEAVRPALAKSLGGTALAALFTFMAVRRRRRLARAAAPADSL